MGNSNLNVRTLLHRAGNSSAISFESKTDMNKVQNPIILSYTVLFLNPVLYT